MRGRFPRTEQKGRDRSFLPFGSGVFGTVAPPPLGGGGRRRYDDGGRKKRSRARGRSDFSAHKFSSSTVAYHIRRTWPLLSTKVWPIQCTRNDQNRPCFYTKRIKTTLDNIFSRPLPSPNPSFSHRNNVTQSGKKRRAFFSSPPPPPTEKRREGRKNLRFLSSNSSNRPSRFKTPPSGVEEEGRGATEQQQKSPDTHFRLCAVWRGFAMLENHLLKSSEAQKRSWANHVNTCTDFPYNNW